MPTKNVIEEAKQLLISNTYSLTANDKTYRRIVPSREFYVHQWNWDSCTHAMGLVHVDEQMAYDEIRSLLSGQWENGLVAQVTFNPNEKKYFPGPEFWGTEQFAHGEIVTSGITQPPFLGIAVSYVYRMARDRKAADEFLEEVLPGVLKYHDYLKTFRDPEDSGLLTIVHPWESGTDNSPRFDTALEAIQLADIPQEVKDLVRKYRTDDKEGAAAERPRLNDYYRYMYLVRLFRSWHWDYKKIVADSPFAFKDLLFSSLWARANTSLSQLFTDVGEKEKAAMYQMWAQQTKQAIQESWNPEKKQFNEYTVAAGKRIPVTENTIASLAPLYAGAVSETLLPEMLAKITDPEQYGTTFPVPSTALNNPLFDPKRYWRGSTWPITNLFLIGGLIDSEGEEAKSLGHALRYKTIQMIEKNGFFEYFHPLTGEGIGFGNFSWTAAIYLYFCNKVE